MSEMQKMNTLQWWQFFFFFLIKLTFNHKSKGFEIHINWIMQCLFDAYWIVLDFSSLTLCPFPPSWPHLVLFVFPHVLLIIIGKIIFHLFPQLPLPLSFFPPFLFLLLFLSFFYSSSILSYISAPVILFPILQISCTSAFFSLLFVFFNFFSFQLFQSIFSFISFA